MYTLNTRILWHINYISIKLFKSHSGLIQQNLLAHATYWVNVWRGDLLIVDTPKPRLMEALLSHTFLWSLRQNERNVVNYLLALKTSTQKWYTPLHVSLAKKVTGSHPTLEMVGNFNSTTQLGKNKTTGIFVDCLNENHTSPIFFPRL